MNSSNITTMKPLRIKLQKCKPRARPTKESVKRRLNFDEVMDDEKSSNTSEISSDTNAAAIPNPTVEDALMELSPNSSALQEENNDLNTNNELNVTQNADLDVDMDDVSLAELRRKTVSERTKNNPISKQALNLNANRVLKINKNVIASEAPVITAVTNHVSAPDDTNTNTRPFTRSSVKNSLAESVIQTVNENSSERPDLSKKSKTKEANPSANSMITKTAGATLRATKADVFQGVQISYTKTNRRTTYTISISHA